MNEVGSWITTEQWSERERERWRSMKESVPSTHTCNREGLVCLGRARRGADLSEHCLTCHLKVTADCEAACHTHSVRALRCSVLFMDCTVSC